MHISLVTLVKPTRVIPHLFALSFLTIEDYTMRNVLFRFVVRKMLRERRISKEILLIFTFIPSLFSML